MSDQLLTIGELARRTRLAPSALRYYEELGLLAPARTACRAGIVPLAQGLRPSTSDLPSCGVWAQADMV